MQFTALPQNEQELLLRCERIAGKTIAEVVQMTQSLEKLTLKDPTPLNDPTLKIPRSLTQAKGWIGQFIERQLGAVGSSSPLPDFANLGIELKTIPINDKGQPQESTFICTVAIEDQHWETCRVYQKLKRVLWVPVEAKATIPIAERRIGNAILWSPTPETEAILKQDWQELMDMLTLGQIDKLSARFGVYLQIRPKAAHSRILYATTNEGGEEILTVPKGFYLRTTLTKKILNENYCY